MITSFFIYLLQTSICIILFYGFYYLILRKENFFQLNRFYLIGTTLLSLAIPYFRINLNQIPSETGTLYLGLDNYLVEGVTSVIAHSNVNWWTTENILFSIYSIGFVFFLMKIVISIFYVFKLKSNGDVQKIQNYYLIQTNTPHPVFSFFNMIFWNKELDYSEKEAEQILLHERVHVNQMHSIDILFLECIHALLWFNPFLYFHKKSLKDTHEFIADYQLFTKYRFQIQYVDLLMKEAKLQRGNSLPVVHTFFNNQLQKRLVMIKNSNKHSSKIKLLGCLPILVTLIFTFSLEPKASAQTSTATEVKNPKAGAIYVARDSDSEMTTKSDGTKRNDEEIKDYIVAKNAKEGETVDRDRIFVISKSDMYRNLGKEKMVDHPEYDGDYRIILINNGTIVVSADPRKKALQKRLKVVSFDATINKPTGSNAETMMMNYKGSTLNKAALEYIASIDKEYEADANIILKNIVVEKDGQKYIIKKEHQLGIDMF